MVKLIYNIPAGNDGEQHKNDNNNIKKYLEFNRDRILDFAQKNYQNLIEAFTKNAIDISAGASKPTLSLRSSLLTFLSQPNQSDIWRIEDSESFHESEGDIAE